MGIGFASSLTNLIAFINIEIYFNFFCPELHEKKTQPLIEDENDESKGLVKEEEAT